MTDFLAQKLPGKGTGKDLAKTVKSWAGKGLFKAEEMEWSGLIPWLEGKDWNVTKEQVVDWLRENNIKIVEVVKDDSSVYGPGFYLYPETDEVKQLKEWESELTEDEIGELIDMEGERIQGKDSGDTIFSQYQTPGGENYREVLLTLPV
jgi:hypothetical protein